MGSWSWEFCQGPKRAMGGGRAKTSKVDCRNAAYTISTVGEFSRIEIFNKHLLGTSEKSCLPLSTICLPFLYYLLTLWALEIWLLPPLSLRHLWKVPLSFAWAICCVDPSLLLWFLLCPLYFSKFLLIFWLFILWANSSFHHWKVNVFQGSSLVPLLFWSSYPLPWFQFSPLCW